LRSKKGFELGFGKKGGLCLQMTYVCSLGGRIRYWLCDVILIRLMKLDMGQQKEL
jgi:hypothetical protein